MDVRPDAATALFVDAAGRVITAQQFTHDLDAVVHMANLSHYFIKPHSFRIGAATTAASIGIPGESIQRMGRWSSGAFTRYIRHQVNRF